jgi:hypothetical protein
LFARNWWLKQKCIDPQFWRLQVQDQGAGNLLPASVLVTGALLEVFAILWFLMDFLGKSNITCFLSYAESRRKKEKKT